jgi:hypothetical protein
MSKRKQTKDEVTNFDVGGRIFKVRRSLLNAFPSTMLARSAAEVWQDNDKPDEPIFIDRDSDRFAYVLDYMRDGEAVLPITVPKNAVLTDLKYYGFEDVSPAVIKVNIPICEAVMQMAPFQQNYEDKIKQLDQSILDSTTEKGLLELAHACFKGILETKKLESVFDHRSDPRFYLLSRTLEKEGIVSLFNKCLDDYGLFFAACTSIGFGGSVKLEFGRLDKEGK